MSAFQGRNEFKQPPSANYYVKVPQAYLFRHSGIHSGRTSDNINVMHDIILLAQYFKIIFFKV